MILWLLQDIRKAYLRGHDPKAGSADLPQKDSADLQSLLEGAVEIKAISELRMQELYNCFISAQQSYSGIMRMLFQEVVSAVAEKYKMYIQMKYPGFSEAEALDSFQKMGMASLGAPQNSSSPNSEVHRDLLEIKQRLVARHFDLTLGIIVGWSSQQGISPTRTVTALAV